MIDLTMPDRDLSQTQRSGAQSVNIQISNQGVSYTEVREIALEVYRANFIELQGVAKEIADQRAQEVTERILGKLIENDPELLAQARDPDMLASIYSAQKSHILGGEKALVEQLANLVVLRAKETERSVRSIVLNESIGVCGRLLPEHIDFLSNLFFIALVSIRMKSVEELCEAIETCVLTLPSRDERKDGFFEYLAYCGCLQLDRSRSFQVTTAFRGHYAVLTAKGFSEEEMEPLCDVLPLIQHILGWSFHAPDRIRVLGGTRQDQEARIEECDIDEEKKLLLKRLRETSELSDREMAEMLPKIIPKCWEFMQEIDQSLAKNTFLTPVGKTIAYARLSARLPNLELPPDWLR